MNHVVDRPGTDSMPKQMYHFPWRQSASSKNPLKPTKALALLETFFTFADGHVIELNEHFGAYSNQAGF